MAFTARDRRDINEIFKKVAQLVGYRWDGFENGVEIGDEVAAGLNPLSDLASTDASKGASLVAVRDADGNFSGTDVEAVLAELSDSIAAFSNDLSVDAATTLTITSGAVTTTQSYHAVDTESAASSDDLDTINGLTNGKLCFLKLANAARNVVLKHGTGNIVCPGAQDVTLDAATDLALAFLSGSSVVVVGLSLTALGGAGLGKALASVANGSGASLVALEDAGTLYAATNLEAALAEARTTIVSKAATTLTIATGAVTATQTSHVVDTEAAAGSDDLDTISGGAAEMFLLLRPASGARTVVLKHNTGNIICPDGADISMADTNDMALLAYANSKWTVLAFDTLVSGNGGLGSLLASVANGKGASLVGFEDAAGNVTAATVEGALAELANYAAGAPQALSGAGAVNLTAPLTCFTATGVGNALTLADGPAGKILRKAIVGVAGFGSNTGILIPSTRVGFASITVAATGDAADLLWTGAAWAVVGSKGAVIA